MLEKVGKNEEVKRKSCFIHVFFDEFSLRVRILSWKWGKRGKKMEFQVATSGMFVRKSAQKCYWCCHWIAKTLECVTKCFCIFKIINIVQSFKWWTCHPLNSVKYLLKCWCYVLAENFYMTSMLICVLFNHILLGWVAWKDEFQHSFENDNNHPCVDKYSIDDLNTHIEWFWNHLTLQIGLASKNFCD